MLDENTNKIVWVAVAVGVVAIIGVAVMALFPGVFDGVKAKVESMMSHFSAASGDVTDSSAKQG